MKLIEKNQIVETGEGSSNSKENGIHSTGNFYRQKIFKKLQEINVIIKIEIKWN